MPISFNWVLEIISNFDLFLCMFEGRNILASGGVFTFSPTQMYCITRQLQLPHVAIEQSGKS